ncbi:MAG TPA: choice-of-anchor D domain-containing protein, partial [Thermoanaerobaculia bacterium]|nr:choice-of-anchor D domain-containing protein [Thermoanaerobaculia bacterium]
ATPAGFFKSTDAGETWASMSAGLPVASEDFHVIAFDPVTTSTIYAASGAGFSSSGHLYKTTNGATSWTATGLVPISVYAVVVDPKTPSVVYASGYVTAGVYKSANGGTSFTRMTTGIPDLSDVPTLAIDPSATSTVYAGVRVTFGSGLHQGVYRSLDGGASWAPTNAGLAGEKVLDVAGDPVNPSVVYAGLAEARVAKSSDGGASWVLKRLADVDDVTAVAVDPKNPSVVYAGLLFGTVLKSTDGGATFPKGASAGGGVLRIAIDPTTSSTVWVTTSAGVAKSTDGGTTFTKASTGVTLPGSFLTTGPIAIDPTATSTVYVAYKGTGVFKTTNGGAAWTAMNAGLPDLNAAGLALDPTSPSTVYVGVTGGVFKSTDGGLSWGARLPGSPGGVTTLAVDPQNPAVLYVGSEAAGAYRSANRGASWAPFSLGLTELNVLAFGFTRTTPSTVYAGTQYGSVFAAQPPAALGPTLSAVSPTSGPTAGGTRVTLTGTNLSADAAVTFGGTAAGNVTNSGPTSLAVTTNAHAAGAVDVRVTNPDGQFATLAGGFTYVAGPGLSVSPSSLDFGTVPVGGTKDLTLTIGNTGVGTLTGSATASAPFSVVSGGSFSLGTGGTQTVTIRFSPSGAGPASGTVSLASNGGGATVALSGSAIEQGGSVFVPIVLSVAGLKGAFFTSELTLTNRGAIGTNVVLTYTAAFGGGSGSATIFLGAGEQKIFADAIEFLRGNGVPLPASGNRGGTLRVRFVALSAPGAGAATVRTTTAVTEGRAGLAYPGLAPEQLLVDTAYICGLRQSAADRSNLAVVNGGSDADGSVVLRLTVFSGAAGAPLSVKLPDIPLAPGGFAQVTEILASNGLSLSNGYVKIERVSGRAPFSAYGVINDQANSDGSFVPPVLVSSLAGRSGLTLPVIVEAGVFTSELVLTNFGPEARMLQLVFVADAVQADGNAATLSLTLAPGEQQILPDIVQVFRDRGVAGIGPKGPSFAGALFAAASGHDVSAIVLAARTSAPGGGGRYGTFYTAIPYGAAASDVVWLYGLQQNGENRSNVALVNTGEVDGSGDGFRLEVYDGTNGALVKTLEKVSLPPRRFVQLTAFLGANAPGTSQAYVKVTRLGGTNPFFAYVVINDGAKPGDRSGDGAFSPGSYASAPLLAVSPASLDFGTFAAGATKDLTFSVRNAGGGTLTGTMSIPPP